MTFEVAADAYDRFMGRYSGPLSSRFADWADIRAGCGRALDVGCGTGALTRVLVDRLGVDHVSAVDPSQQFVSRVRQELPTLDVQSASADQLPYRDDLFDRVVAQLVVHFMADPVGGVREMGRVTRPGGVVAACVWDHAGGGGPLTLFWRAVHDLDPGARGEGDLPGTSEGSLSRIVDDAGLTGIEETALTVPVRHESFDDWWEPYTFGVGPAGDYVLGLDVDHRAALRARCLEIAPEAPFYVMATAWAVRATA